MRWAVPALLACAWLPLFQAGEHVDEDYRFRLTRPSKDWSLLTEAEARQVVPDAVAMLTGPGGLFMAVVVEHAPAADIAGFARVALDSMALENRVEERFETVRFLERDAVCFQVSGTTSGLRMRFQSTSFANGDYYYQVVCWGGVELVDEQARAFERPLAAFSLLPGVPRARRAARASPDARGVGWCLTDGVFESAAYGLRVVPAEPWRVVVGAELQGMNPAAEFGLVCESPDLRLVVIPERIVGVPAETLAAQLRADYALEQQPTGAPVRVPLGGGTIELVPSRDAESPGFSLLRGVVAREELSIQVLAWFLGEPRAEALDLITAACGAVHFLGEDERAALERTLAALPEPDSEVGPEYSLRAGVYRDYGADLLWRKPPGWRVLLGQEARATWGEETRLVLEHPRLGVLGMLFVYDTYDSPAEEHEGALANFFEELPDVAREVRFGGREALESQASTPDEGLPPAFRVTTAQAAGRSYELVFYGLESNMRAAEAELDRVRAAFQLAAGLLEPDVEDGVYRDEKMGFELRSPGPGWRANTELVPGDAAQNAGSCGWADPQGREVFALAIGGLTGGRDARAIEDMIVGEMGRRLRGKEEESESQLEGLTARKRTFRTSRSSIEVLIVRNGNTLFVLGISARGGEPTLETAQELFSFLP